MLKRLLNTTSLKANIAANFAGNIWSALIGFIFIPIYLKYIGAEGYGLIGIFSSLQIVLSLLDSGLSTTLNRELARLSVLKDTQQRMRNIVRTLGNIYWCIAVLVGILALFISPLLAKYWVHPKELSVQTITYAFILLSLSFVFEFPSGFYNGGLLGLQRQVFLNSIKIIFSVFRNVGALLILVFISKSILVFFSWTLFITLSQAFALKFFLWYYLPKSSSKPKFDKNELRNVWRFAAGMIFISLTSVLLTQVDKIILSKILSLEQFGYYSISCTVGLFILQVVSPLTQSYFPKFSNLISLNKIDDLKNLYHQACQLVSTLVLPATFILIFFSKELIFIWTHNEVTTQNIWLVTSIYAYGTGINGLMNIPYILTLSYGWTKLAIYQNIFFVILMIPLTIFLSLKFGAIGGAISWATINTMYFFITPQLIHKKYLKGEVFYWYWHDSVKPLIAALALVAAGWYFLPVYKFSSLPQFFIIAFIGLAAVCGSLFFSDDLRNNFIALFKKMRLKLNG